MGVRKYPKDIKCMNYKMTATNIRRLILEMHYEAQSSHIASSLSCVDILTALYFKVLRVNPAKPLAPSRDRFILSKGHAASSLYATLALRGFFRKDVLKRYCLDNNCLPGHSTRGSVPGVEVSTGSLGHGLSIGAGIALAGRNDNRDYRVFVLMSDGECEEGSVWEAAMFARQHKLDNLISIIDYNKIQAFGWTKEVLDLEPFAEKWKAFGWEVREIDGHNFQEIVSCLKKIPFNRNIPSVIIAHTVKGKGVRFMENKLDWHYKSPNKEELKEVLAGLKE